MNWFLRKLKSFISVSIDNKTLATKNRLQSILKMIFPIRFIKEKKLFLNYKKFFEETQLIFSENLNLNIENPDTNDIVLSSRVKFDLNKHQQKNKKQYLQEITNIFDYAPDSPEVLFASSPKVIKSVMNYMQCFPVLHNITLMYSPNKFSESPSGSQLWHRDAEDVKNIKIWIPVNDIDEDCGPTEILNKDISEEIARKLNYVQGALVEENHALFSQVKPAHLVGKAGEIMVTDTGSSFHRGSNPKNNESKERLVLMIHYVSGFSAYHRPFIGLKPMHCNNKWYNFKIRDQLTLDLLRFIN